MVDFQHPIQVASRLTGLSPHVIRVWERRYGAVTPTRTGTNRRVYSDQEVERLRLLARATEAGHKIGIIARMGLEDLQRLVVAIETPERNNGKGQPNGDGGNGAGTEPMGQGGRPFGTSVGGTRPRDEALPDSVLEVERSLVNEGLGATRDFQGDRLQRVLDKGAVRWGHNGILRRVIAPLAELIGVAWQRGEITAAHEHFASAIIRDFLMRHARPYAVEPSAPRATVATPAGQLHELGAVMAAASAANLGWNPIYLGASLPAAEIAGATIQNGAKAVLLSIVYPADDERLTEELVELRKLVPREVHIVAGGRAARSYAATLKAIGAGMPNGLDALCELLERIRDAQGLSSL